MKALSELEAFLNSPKEILFHLYFVPLHKDLYKDTNIEINEDKKEVKFIDKHGFHTTVLYESWFINEVVRKIHAATNEIDSELIEISKNNKNPNEYLKLILKRIGIILQKASASENQLNILPFLKNFQRHFDQLKNFKDFTTSKDPLLANSFDWYGKDKEENLLQIKKLLELLTKSPPLIDCTEQEFINAFTNQPVKSGIKWLVTGPSKQISKRSLFYLIDLLVNKELLDFQPSEYNSKIEYVFRDQFGNGIKNIRQSKVRDTSKPALKDRIDDIIDELIKSL